MVIPGVIVMMPRILVSAGVFSLSVMFVLGQSCARQKRYGRQQSGA
jgi:hypothetical protein